MCFDSTGAKKNFYGKDPQRSAAKTQKWWNGEEASCSRFVSSRGLVSGRGRMGIGTVV